MPGPIGHCCLIWSICVLRQWDVAEVQVCCPAQSVLLKVSWLVSGLGTSSPPVAGSGSGAGPPD